MRVCSVVTVLIFALAYALPAALADTISLTPIADTTLLESNPANNMGGHVNFISGRGGSGPRNHALIQFDPAAAIPAGAVITNVSLRLIVTVASTVNSDFELHRLLVPWGEGNKTGSTGQLATAGEATWNERLAGTASWTQPGAAPTNDFIATASTITPVAGLGTYTFNATSAMIADVQLWLDSPGANFGWLLLSALESVPGTNRRFGSREDTSGNAPQLVIDFTAVPEPGVAPLLALACGGWWLHRRSIRSN